MTCVDDFTKECLMITADFGIWRLGHVSSGRHYAVSFLSGDDKDRQGLNSTAVHIHRRRTKRWMNLIQAGEMENLRVIKPTHD